MIITTTTEYTSTGDATKRFRAIKSKQIIAVVGSVSASLLTALGCLLFLPPPTPESFVLRLSVLVPLAVRYCPLLSEQITTLPAVLHCLPNYSVLSTVAPTTHVPPRCMPRSHARLEWLSFQCCSLILIWA